MYKSYNMNPRSRILCCYLTGLSVECFIQTQKLSLFLQEKQTNLVVPVCGNCEYYPELSFRDAVFYLLH